VPATASTSVFQHGSSAVPARFQNGPEGLRLSEEGGWRTNRTGPWSSRSRAGGSTPSSSRPLRPRSPPPCPTGRYPTTWRCAVTGIVSQGQVGKSPGWKPGPNPIARPRSAQRDRLTSGLAAAGRDGRGRRFADDREQARLAAGRTIRPAIQPFAAAEPAIGAHLAGCTHRRAMCLPAGLMPDPAGCQLLPGFRRSPGITVHCG
jgi:hypothetical protein